MTEGMSLPIYNKRDYKYPELDSCNSCVFKPNLNDFRGKNCLKDNCPFHNVRDSFTEVLSWG
jgi:hypothetical protein